MRAVVFHNVVAEPLDAFDRRIYRTFQEAFARAMERLTQRFEVISLPEMLRRLHSRIESPDAVTITFDDGFAGVFDSAYPVLRELGVTATVFLPTSVYRAGDRGTCAHELLHFEVLEIAMRLSLRETIELPEMGLGCLTLSSPMQRAKELVDLKSALKKLPWQRFTEMQALALERLQVPREEIQAYAAAHSKFHKLSFEQIRALLSEGWTMGGHTRHHYPFQMLEGQELAEEVEGNYRDMETIFGIGDVPFAYPYGSVGTAEQAVPGALRRAGFSCAFTTERRPISVEDDLFLLGRYGERDVLYDLLETSLERPQASA